MKTKNNMYLNLWEIMILLETICYKNKKTLKNFFKVKKKMKYILKMFKNTFFVKNKNNKFNNLILDS